MKILRTLAPGLAAILLGWLGGAVAAADAPASDFKVAIDGTGNGVTALYVGKGGNVVIPAELEGFPVTGLRGFVDRKGITSVTIPDSVTGIGSFRDCRDLTSITIPNSVTWIQEHAFKGCSGLTAITIPAGVTVIEIGTFRGCSSLRSVTIPNGVTKIKSNAFEECTGLTSITIPGSVTEIASGAFDYCKNLTTVNFTGDNQIEFSAAHDTFSGCEKLSLATQAALKKRGWYGK
ncbi:MAG: leucine-rich repeat domain-containing protein [Planctomycetota bacterium]|jgi:hypothetical protein|nr:leucine-rich repeat domain-containing protein [Planctomycetota bacterium]